MKRRLKIIAPIAVVVILLGIAYLLILHPRIMLYSVVKEFIKGIPYSADYFTEYTVHNDTYTQFGTDWYTLELPPDIQLQPHLEGSSLRQYKNPDETITVILSGKSDNSDFNMYAPENYGEISTAELNMELERFKNGFDKIGKGHPDSAYGLLKCAALINSDDYDFWDLEKAYAFSVVGLFKALNEPITGRYHLIYESEEICGIFSYSNKTDEETNAEYYSAWFDFYSTDDLNTAYCITAKTQTLEEAYAIVNSIKFNN